MLLPRRLPSSICCSCIALKRGTFACPFLSVSGQDWAVSSRTRTVLRKMENPQGSPLRAELARDDAVLGGPEADT